MGTDSRDMPIYDGDRVPPNATHPYIEITYEKVDPPAGWGSDEVMWFFKRAVLWTEYNSSYNLGFTEDTFSFERARQRAYTMLYDEDDDMPGLVG